MDIYQIIITHNRSWTIREIIAFAVVFLMAVFLAAVLLRLHKIVIIQAVCGLLLLTFLSIVFGSTVFTRTPGIRQYQPEVFWSWKEILGIGTCGRLGSTTGWFTAGESVEYSATFSGRDFIAGGDRQKTEMVDGIACGNCGIICYRD